MPQHPNVIMLLIDNLRYDVFSDRDKARRFFPNMSKLINGGFIHRIVSNGHATKFAMAPIFSQTYPLDYDGYNYVMQNRPCSFVELLQSAGYRTVMYQADDNDGPVSKCERGFDKVEAIYDFRILLKNFIDEVLQYECRRWDSGEQTDAEIASFLQNKFGAVLDHLANAVNRIKGRRLPAWNSSPNRYWRNRFREERNLLDRNPTAVAKKILQLESHFYHLCLGMTAPHGFKLSFFKQLYWVGGGISSVLSLREFIPIRILTSQTPTTVHELLTGAYSVIRHEKLPWFIFAHIMDVHDRLSVRRPLYFLQRLSCLKQWLRNPGCKINISNFLYDAALAQVDRELGQLMDSATETANKNQTIFVICSDHGCELEDADKRGVNEVFGWRAHPEHIEVPLICSPTDKSTHTDGVHDSMTFSATVLDLLGVAPDPSFKGKSAFSAGRPVVISENAGRGNADLQRSNIYFTMTSTTHKAMAHLKGTTLTIHRLYDCRSDPDELNNIVKQPAATNVVGYLVDGLFRERSTLLSNRGVQRGEVQITDMKNQP